MGRERLFFTIDALRLVRLGARRSRGEAPQEDHAAVSWRLDARSTRCTAPLKCGNEALTPRWALHRALFVSALLFFGGTIAIWVRCPAEECRYEEPGRRFVALRCVSLRSSSHARTSTRTYAHTSTQRTHAHT